MKTARRLPQLWVAVLGLTAACASGAPGPEPAATSLCPEAPEALTVLQMDCRGEVKAGLAEWVVDGAALVLDLGTGLSARSLVQQWPALDEAPWLGHAVSRVVLLSGDRIRVEFREGVEVPVALFTDPRLGPTASDSATDLDADVRDRIDRGDVSLRTRNEASVDYGRSLGHEVSLDTFDRRYVIVFREAVQQGFLESIRGTLAGRWVRSGVTGTRRLPPKEGGDAAGCWPISRSRGEARLDRALPVPGGAVHTVGYPASDPVAREIAERLVSVTLGGGSDWLEGGRLSVRPHEGGGANAVAPSDVATIATVTVGAVHPCSVSGEIERVLSWFGPDVRGEASHLRRARVVGIGETAVFRIEGEVRQP